MSGSFMLYTVYARQDNRVTCKKHCVEMVRKNCNNMSYEIKTRIFLLYRVFRNRISIEQVCVLGAQFALKGSSKLMPGSQTFGRYGYRRN